LLLSPRLDRRQRASASGGERAERGAAALEVAATRGLLETDGDVAPAAWRRRCAPRP
jgi:hypothetical protein